MKKKEQKKSEIDFRLPLLMKRQQNDSKIILYDVFLSWKKA